VVLQAGFPTESLVTLAALLSCFLVAIHVAPEGHWVGEVLSADAADDVVVCVVHEPVPPEGVGHVEPLAAVVAQVGRI